MRRGRFVRMGAFLLASTVLPFLAVNGQADTSRADRFKLYNHCAPMGLVIENLPASATAVGLNAAQLKKLAVDRLRSVALHETDAPTVLHMTANPSAVRLWYMKPVIDVASKETELMRTYYKFAKVNDGSAAGVMLAVSQLLDSFLVEYRRVNQSECGNASPKLLPGEASAGFSETRRDPVQPASEPGSDEGRVDRVGNRFTPPRLLSKVEPEYSEEARKRGIQGTVRLSVEIGEDGRIYNAKVLQSLGSGLDEKAVEAVKQWKFRPAQRNGTAVKTSVQIGLSFSLLGTPKRGRKRWRRRRKSEGDAVSVGVNTSKGRRSRNWDCATATRHLWHPALLLGPPAIHAAKMITISPQSQRGRASLSRGGSVVEPRSPLRVVLRAAGSVLARRPI